MFNKQSKLCALIIIFSTILMVSNSASAADIVNVSTRGLVGTGQENMVVGFTIQGSGTTQLVLMAVGPTLSKFGIKGILADPKFI